MSAWTCRHLTVRPTNRLFHLCPQIPYWKGVAPESEEKQEPASDIDTEVVDSLKALDPDRPIREADITHRSERSLLLDHLVGAGEHRPGNGKTERLGALQVDDKLEFGRLLDRNVGRLRPAQNLVGDPGGAAGRNLAPMLKKGAVGRIEPVRQHRGPPSQ